MSRKADRLLNAIWQEENLVHADDSTVEIIRKHKLFREITEAISKDELQRGRDFGGTEEDSIYNDLSELEEMLFERSIMKHNREARDYLNEVNPIDCEWWIAQKLAVVREAHEALTKYGTNFDESFQKAKALLKSLLPDEYPKQEDSEE